MLVESVNRRDEREERFKLAIIVSRPSIKAQPSLPSIVAQLPVSLRTAAFHHGVYCDAFALS